VLRTVEADALAPFVGDDEGDLPGHAASYAAMLCNPVQLGNKNLFGKFATLTSNV
jgi:hypothetical protein